MILWWRKRRKKSAQSGDIVFQQGRGENKQTSVEWRLIRRSDGRWGFWVEIVDLIDGKWITRAQGVLPSLTEAMRAVHQEHFSYPIG